MTIDSVRTATARRLKPEILAVTVGGKNIAELSDLSMRDALAFIGQHRVQRKGRNAIARQIIKEIKARLQFLVDVGLDYLTLSRAPERFRAASPSAFVWQRRLAPGWWACSISSMSRASVCTRKTTKNYWQTLRHLTDIGNTLIVVEHDEDTMYAADHIVDIGPGAGLYGGELVAQGSVQDINALQGIA